MRMLASLSRATLNLNYLLDIRIRFFCRGWTNELKRGKKCLWLVPKVNNPGQHHSLFSFFHTCQEPRDLPSRARGLPDTLFIARVSGNPFSPFNTQTLSRCNYQTDIELTWDEWVVKDCQTLSRCNYQTDVELTWDEWVGSRRGAPFYLKPKKCV